MSLDADATIYRFGHELNAWCHNSARVKQTSTLYDLPGRSTIGFALLYDVVPDFLRELDAASGREPLGAAMRSPLVRPNAMAPLIVLESWLMGRERLIVDAGERLPASVDLSSDAADWELVGGWYSDVVGAMRADGDAFPTRAALFGPDGDLAAGETIHDQPLLDEAQIAALGADAEPLDAAVAARVQRALGAFDLFALTLHGEQRDGLFDRGPWRREDGWSVALHEVNDLDNDVLPWGEEETRFGLDAVGVLRAYRPGVEVRIDMWGTLGVRPLGPPDQVRGVWARRGEKLQPIEVEELEELANRATAATAVLYAKMAAWEPDYRISYGAPLFLNHLVPLARTAGAEDPERWLPERAASVVAEQLDRLRGAEAHPIWARLARTDTDIVYTSPEALL